MRFSNKSLKEIHFEEIDSTNLEAERAIDRGEIMGPTLISANHQTAGKGSRGRKWISSHGNIHSTFIFPIPEDFSHISLAPFVIGIATQKIIAQMASAHSVQIKWPNDILVNEKKISGSLFSLQKNDQRTYLIAGIGINCNVLPNPADAPGATSLKELLGADIDTVELLRLLANLIEAEIACYIENPQPSYIIKRYKEVCFGMGRRIKIQTFGGLMKIEEGWMEGISDKGALMLRTKDGLRQIFSAEIFPSLQS